MEGWMRLFTVALVVGLVTFSVRSPAAVGDVAKAKQKRKPEAAVREAIGKLRVGMSFQKVEAALKPVLLASGRASFGGSGLNIRFYHLRGDWQLALESGPFPKDETVASMGKLVRKEPWRGLSWTPCDADKRAAAKIATAALRDELKASRNHAAKFPTHPGGMLVSDDKLSAELEVKPGTKTSFVVSAAEGRWMTHKLVSVNFLEGETWRFQIVVDMDDGKAVPSQWTPTEQNIAKARAVADQTIGEFLGKTPKERDKVKVESLGEYDYGPLRRILILVYSKATGDGGESQEWVLIDFEKMKPLHR
jgi:hypothetical protein